MPSDRALVRKFQRGDPEALLAIYQRYRDYLLSVGMAMVRDMDRAEDTVHDVFVSLAQKRREFRFRGNLKACLAIAVVNRTRDILRRQSVRAAASLDSDAPIVSPSPAPEQIAMLNEQCRRLAVALGRLPQEQREVIVLRHKCGLPLREIAKVQQTGISTVDARYRYGLNTLRALMNGELDDDTGR